MYVFHILLFILTFSTIYSQKQQFSLYSSRQKTVASPGGIQGETTLCGRLGQALKSDTYGDFRLGQLTQVNIVVVSG